MNSDNGISKEEAELVGTVVEGTVLAVFRWGVIVDLQLSHVGLIDVLYVDDDDHYSVGDRVSGHLTDYNELMGQFWLRPLGQVPVSERIRKKGL